MDVCTIVAKNYLPQARVLAHSFREHHPGGRFWTLIIDSFDGYIDPRDEQFDILTPADVGCGAFDQMAARYDVLELSTAVKPWLLRHLLEQGSGTITYLDPDIKIYGSLVHLDESARAHGLALTPHNIEPLPDDGERPSQIDILIAGVYNLGYVSLTARGEIFDLLAWWSDRLLNDCRFDPVYGYFVDQRWFDLAPGLVSDRAIVRDAGCNVAYWNVHSRRLERRDGGVLVNGEPLRFYHFSGFDPANPGVLSRHQTRVRLEDQPVLAEICREYALEVDQHGHGEARDWPYDYDFLPDGTRFTRGLRRLWAGAEEAGAVTASPFTSEGFEPFADWLAQVPDGSPPGVHRVLARLYETRPDLQRVFPDLAGADRRRFVDWARRTHEPELTTPPTVWQRVGEPDHENEPEDAQLPSEEPSGVNVVGYFRSELGVGEAVRQVVGALDAADVPLLPIHGATIPPNRQGHGFTYLAPEDARFSTNLICMNADMLPEFANQVGPDFFADRYSIGMWFWEVSAFPSRWLNSFGLVNEVWAPSQHVADALNTVSPTPVLKMRLPVELSRVLPRSRADLRLPDDGFLFLFSFDYHSVVERKNPLAVVAAFTCAFAPGSGAKLVLKCINSGADPAAHERLRAAVAAHPDIVILDGYLDPADKNALMHACDCYVSLHRSEGFGLSMAEAMYLGKPVIATGYSGNVDFMNGANSYLVDYELVPIGAGNEPYPPDGVWADPDIEHAARLMRSAFEHPEDVAERGAQAAADIRRLHSPRACGEWIVARLNAIPVRQTAPLPPPAAPAALVPLGERVRRGPAPAPGTNPLRRLARRLVLRATRPYVAHQTAANQEIVRAFGELHVSVAQVHADANQRRREEALRRAHGLARLLRDGRNQNARVHELTVRLDGDLVAMRDEREYLLKHSRDTSTHLESLDEIVSRIDYDLRALPYIDQDAITLEVSEDRHVGAVLGYKGRLSSDSGAGYLSFENVFRGSEDFIRERQRVYLDVLGGREPVLDIGCGRGEFLDLLREREISYRGVDADAAMVERCRKKDHFAVVHGDGLAVLENVADGSLGAVFCAQVIEHLPPDRFLELLALTVRKLQPRGMLIAETVNPHSPAALKTFWVDPTHHHPIFPEVALVLCREAGFERAYVFHPNGSGDVKRDRFVQGEYAVVAMPVAVALGANAASRRVVTETAE